MRGAFAGAILMVLLCCAPASALDPVCSSTSMFSVTQTNCTVATPVATVSCSYYDDQQNAPHESTIETCGADAGALTASCTSDQESGGSDPNTGECAGDAAGTTIDCTRYETFIYASNDDMACGTSTAGGTATTCETDHTNDFFATGDSSRVTGCSVGDTASCYITTRPDTDPDDPAFPVPDGTDPAITPSSGCPAQ